MGIQERRHVRRGTWLVLLLTCAVRSAAAQPLTFAHDVAPLVYSKCTPCHHAGGDAPFSLSNYDEVRRRAQQIVAVTAERYMPPWKASKGGPFIGDRHLSDDEIARLARWVKEGAREGNAAATPPTPRFTGGWLHGTPDLVVSLPSYRLRADGADVFRNFVVTVPGNGRRYVKAFQFVAGNRAVHHANIFVDDTAASRQLDANDPLPGYEGLILHSAVFPDGQFLGWTPGQAPPPTTDATWSIDGGNDLVVQLHMQPTGREETIAPAIGLYFTDTPSPSPATMLRLGRQNLRIDANDTAHVVTDDFILPVDARVVAVQPHAHQRATRVTAEAILPDRSTRTLIEIDQWDFRWQDQYRFATPPWLPAGTTIRMAYRYDNSDANPRNPDRPARLVEWGWRTSDEMGDVWLQLTTRNDDDRARLRQATVRKMTEEEAIGAETLISRQPDYTSLRNDAAMLYMGLGRPLDALRHFAAVTMREPQSATAWYNEGVALEGAGRADEAADRYRRAIALNPSYSPAHNNLGHLLANRGDHAGALEQFQLSVASDAQNAEGHCSLARALTIAGDAAAARREYQTALTLHPDWPVCLMNYAWLLAAHADPSIRQPEAAINAAERAVALTNRSDAATLDALAVAYASGGQFDKAVAAETQALTIAERASSPLTSEIRERLALFRSRRTFVVPD